MGYSTEFEGSFLITPPIAPEHANYIRSFNETRHMKLKENEAENLSDSARESADLPLGIEGAYFANPSFSNFGSKAPFVLDHNHPPTGQPGLWCQWTVPLGSSTLEWDEGEKFYEWVAWLRYLIEHFFGPWNYRLNGQVSWDSEDGTSGVIILSDNEMNVQIRNHPLCDREELDLSDIPVEA